MAARVFVLSLILVFAATLRAEARKPLSFDFCFSAETETVRLDDKHIAFSWGRLMAIATSNLEHGLFRRSWARCVGNGSLIEGVFSVSDSCKFSDDDGDEFFLTIRRVNDRVSGNDLENKVALWAGTGKFVGIKGKARIVSSDLFAEDVPEFFVGCDRIEGSYEISGK